MSIKSSESLKTLIIGSNGCIGSYLTNSYLVLKKNVNTVSRSDCPSFDLCKPTTWAFNESFDYGIICAGVTKISQCEKDPLNTYHVNVNQVLALIEHLLNLKITPIIFSSDYVFDGEQGNYSEESPTNAVNEYGKQKQALEKEIESKFSNCSVVLRLSKVYGNEETQDSFIKEMIDLFIKEKFVKAAADQIFCPVHLEDIFQTICYIQENQLTGLFNVCGPKVWQRHQIAEIIADIFGFDRDLIQKISLKDLGEKFQRPFNTSMVSNKLNLKTFSSIEDHIYKLFNDYGRKRIVE